MAKIAFVLADDFEDSEFRQPYDELRAAGHEVTVVGLTDGAQVHGKKGKETVTVDTGIDAVRPEDFDALVIPGGYSPDKLRVNQGMVGMVRSMSAAGKPVAAVCHGPWLLAEADVLRGRTVTSWPSIKTDLVNAGAQWVDEEVTQDGNLITSRKPGDLPAFTKAVEAALA